ncbi:SIMPL domain-containing protein [Neisseria canis]|uniref:Oxidative stress defense protein n=1 Tax=Neisseria canis TaxID=493 RepID=A0A448DAN2_9NEIS|nr:SIMPL domain-containing protein [Neisseria canis]OSI11828.1 hypothetical protein BWD07_08540 [Neisseria canis]VEF03030.1 oxidative stress defense protein [Neisseria canis]
MRKTIALLLLSLVAAPTLAEPLNYNVVSFSESASTTADNDLMRVIFSIEEEGSNRQAVSNRITNRLNALNARISANKAFKGAVINRSTQPNYNEKGKITGWYDSAQVSVESKDFQALNKLIAASQNDAAVQNLSFTVSREKRSEITNELSKQALKNFKQRAEVISQTLGFRGYKIVNIQINSNFHTRQASVTMKSHIMDAAAEAAPEMTADNPGTEEITQTVSGSIQM